MLKQYLDSDKILVIELLGMPSGQILTINFKELPNLNPDLINYKRYIKMYGEIIAIHGWVFLDSNIMKIKNKIKK